LVWISERQARAKSHDEFEKKRAEPKFDTHFGAASTNA
jgi:hypothetical protein